MKKIFLTIALAASLLTVNTYAATFKAEDGTENVSYAALTKFNNDYAGAENVSWKVSNNFQKVTFTLDGTKMSAFYNLRGEVMGVTQNVQFNALPEKARKEIAAKYEGYFAKEVIKLETGEDSFDNTVYFVDLAKDGKELLVRVTPGAGVYFFQNVK
ncbi:hypothetical protein [Mucilaginibacter pedocola]|uniref:Beta-lactamase-inhibitor-like PepSY-like domain-containing protein n=1 Tax=Mucilaginibacter pedocola TaxID=1792845 RepID=A0A1S9PMD4_9SPHI|nr:hypothetical protein [Mucilaginibacter pedocola]OOQ62120.1 hypothetical protein BC343_03460 [Mucilaginibacter pedocola]